MLSTWKFVFFKQSFHFTEEVLQVLGVYAELHLKTHSAASPAYGDTTCMTLFRSLATYKAQKFMHTLKA